MISDWFLSPHEQHLLPNHNKSPSLASYRLVSFLIFNASAVVYNTWSTPTYTKASIKMAILKNLRRLARVQRRSLNELVQNVRCWCRIIVQRQLTSSLYVKKVFRFSDSKYFTWWNDFHKGDTRTHAKYIVRKHDSAPVPIAVVQLLDSAHGLSRCHVTAFFLSFWIVRVFILFHICEQAK